MTTTDPIRKSFMALAASVTNESERSATGSLVITSRTVLPIAHLLPWNSAVYKEKRATPRTSRQLDPVFELAVPLTGWGSLASNGRALHCFRLDGLGRLKDRREHRAATHTDEPTHDDVAWKVVAEVHARDADPGRQRKDQRCDPGVERGGRSEERRVGKECRSGWVLDH